MDMLFLMNSGSPPMFEEFGVFIQVYFSQTTKDIIGSVNHIQLQVSMRSAKYPMQCRRNVLVAKYTELEAAQAALDVAQAAHNNEKRDLLDKISSLIAFLEYE